MARMSRAEAKAAYDRAVKEFEVDRHIAAMQATPEQRKAAGKAAMDRARETIYALRADQRRR